MNYSEFDSVTLQQLQEYLEHGNIDSVPANIASRLTLMELVRTLMVDQNKNYDYIIRILQLPPYSLSRYLADKVYSDTLNFHYAQKDVTEAAICNLYAEKLDKTALLCIASNKFEEAGKCYDKAASYRLQAISKKDIPDSIFDKRQVLYSINIELAGGKLADRNKLAKFIDNIPDIDEADRVRLHRDGMTGDKNSFFYDITDAEIDIDNEKENED